MPRMVMPPRIGDELPLRRYRMIKSTTGAAECLARSRWVNQNRACRGQSLRCIGIRRAQAFVRQPTTQWAIVKRKSRTIGPPRHRGGDVARKTHPGGGGRGRSRPKIFCPLASGPGVTGVSAGKAHHFPLARGSLCQNFQDSLNVEKPLAAGIEGWNLATFSLLA